MHIIFESVLSLYTSNCQNQSMLVETTACQSWLVFLRHTVVACRKLYLSNLHAKLLSANCITIIVRVLFDFWETILRVGGPKVGKFQRSAIAGQLH